MFGLRKRSSGGELGVQDRAWTAVEGGTREAPVFIRRNNALAALAGRSGFDQMVIVSLPCIDADETGMPGPGDFDRFTAFEDGLAEAFTDGTQAMLALVITREAARRFVLYTNDEPATRAVVERLADSIPGPQVAYGASPDPEWKSYRAFMALV